ncbi:hypothetical protein Fmac_007756 [Flemingia macrophylla]|uniref:Uncharacterized protein n=1 Tax=Flemingia macrophylla TaxID=520843 RepID=A0ABD1MVI0_9FABA
MEPNHFHHASNLLECNLLEHFEARNWCVIKGGRFFLRVRGKEHPGYVRGMGLGVSPSQIIGSSSHATSSTTSFESNERMEQMQAEIDSLKAQVAEVDVLKQHIAFLMQRAKRDEDQYTNCETSSQQPLTSTLRVSELCQM